MAPTRKRVLGEIATEDVILAVHPKTEAHNH